MPPADTKDRILDTAARLFHEQGYNATGIATILRESGINAGSLYHFFPSKDALLLGVLERYRVLVHPIVLGPVERAQADPIGRVFALLDQYRSWLEPMGFAMGCPIGNLALELADGNAQVRRLVDINFEGWYLGVKKWLDDAGERLPQAIDRMALAKFILTVMEGGIMQARAAASAAPWDESVHQLRVYFDLLEAQAARERTRGIKTAAPRRARPAVRTRKGKTR